MQLDDLFTCGEENENSNILFSVCSTRLFEIKRKGKKLIFDFGNFKPCILFDLASRMEQLATELLKLDEGAIFSTLGYNYENNFLQPCADVELTNTELQLNDSSKEFLITSFDEFFMRCVFDTHGFHQSRLWQQLSDKQIAVVEKHANVFLESFGGKTISTPLMLNMLDQKRNLHGTFIKNKTTPEIYSEPYDICAYFNGYIITENELHLLLENGAKTKVYYDSDKHSETVFSLAHSRHKLRPFKVSEKFCVFHGHSATHSTRIRPPSPRPFGH